MKRHFIGADGMLAWLITRGTKDAVGDPLYEVVSASPNSDVKPGETLEYCELASLLSRDRYAGA